MKAIANPKVRPLRHDDVAFVDLFCGGGGSTTGALWALRELGIDVDTPGRCIAVNHDKTAIATHEWNHQDVLHIDCDIERLNPASVLCGRLIYALSVSSPCQEWSVAAGGPTKRKQQRATPAYMLAWVRIGRPQVIVEENVWEITEKWDGWPQHVRDLEAEGYRVEVRKLDAANHGVPQNRKRMFLLACRDDLPIVWPKQTHSDPRRPVPGTEPWRGAIEALDLDEPCPSMFNRGTYKNGRPRKLPKKSTRQRIGRFVREKGRFWEPLARAAETGRGPVPLAKALAACPEAEWPEWIVRHDDHIHILATEEPAIMASGGPAGQMRGRDAARPSNTVMGNTRLGVLQPKVVVDEPFVTTWNRNTAGRTIDQPTPTVAAQGNHIGVARFTLGQNGGAEGRDCTLPSATAQTAGFIRVGEVRCMLDTFSSEDTCWLARTKDTDRPTGAVLCRERWALVEGRLTIPKDGYYRPPGPKARAAETPSTAVRATRGGPDIAEIRLTEDACILPHHGEAKGQKPRMHPARKPSPTLPASRGLDIAYVVLTYNGNANIRGIDRPNTTVTTVERHMVVVVRLDGLMLDIGVRMCTVRELARLQTFPDWYWFAGNKGDQTRQIGNAVPCLLFYAILMALLGPRRFPGRRPAPRRRERVAPLAVAA